MPRNKRKREEENEETVDDKSIVKKSRLHSNSSEGIFVLKLIFMAKIFCKHNLIPFPNQVWAVIVGR